MHSMGGLNPIHCSVPHHRAISVCIPIEAAASGLLSTAVCWCVFIDHRIDSRTDTDFSLLQLSQMCSL